MNNNYVNLVGYQLEKVHTGVIKWLLDTRNTLVPVEMKYEMLRRIYQMTQNQMDFHAEDIASITCLPEYSFGRKRKIDLVVKIETIQQQTKYIVIEMKVDSIPYSSQLEGTKNDFLNTNKGEDVIFLLMLFGSSQVCEIPELHQFHLFRLPEIIEVFNGHQIEDVIYTQWLNALFDEDYRRSNILDDLNVVTNIWKMEEWSDKGYRTPFPLFYYLYHHLRMRSKRQGEWEIYSGQNNPVMNWSQGWLSKDIMGYPVKFYWEFNYEEFVLKGYLDGKKKLPQADWIWLRKEIAQICYREIQSGNPTRKTYGTHVSIYKWKFDFKDDPFEKIMEVVDMILDRVPPVLSTI